MTLQGDLSDAEMEGWLQTLGVQSLAQWDVLVFLYRHQISLAGADHLARLLGYAVEPTIAALDALESLGLVKRSRVEQNVRMYQFVAPADGPRREAFEHLLAFADERVGRSALAKRLRQNDRSARDLLLAAPQLLENEKRRKTWRKAI
jgi:DNA-binding MarR family transcriptional regulator